MSDFHHLTPVNVTYATCARAYAELRLYPDSMRVEEVSRLLGNIAPTTAYNAGDVIQNSEGRSRTVGRSYWTLSSEGVVHSLDVREHLDWLIDKLMTASGLIQLQTEHSVLMTVCCVWCSRSGHGGPTLWPRQMRELAKLNLELTFDCYLETE